MAGSHTAWQHAVTLWWRGTRVLQRHASYGLLQPSQASPLR